jgi:hypothetical protein
MREGSSARRKLGGAAGVKGEVTMKTQTTAWYDKANDRVMHGVKIYHEGEWMNYAEDGRPFLCADERDAETKRAELRKLKAWDAARLFTVLRGKVA